MFRILVAVPGVLWERCPVLFAKHPTAVGDVPLQARLDGVEVSIGLVEEQLSTLVEDELDAVSHPWAPSLRQRAGLPSFIPTTASHSAAAAAGQRYFLAAAPIDAAAAMESEDAAGQPEGLRNAANAPGVWPLLQGMQTVLHAAGVLSTHYGRLRSRTMAAMLQPCS